MWPFTKNDPEYTTGHTVSDALPPKSGRCFDSTPPYVPPGAPPNPPPSPAVLPAIRVDVACPAIDATGASSAKGSTIVLLAPAGATRYRAWFAPARATDVMTPLGAIPMAIDEPAAGKVVDGEVPLTPVWARLSSYRVDAGSVASTLLVTFDA